MIPILLNHNPNSIIGTVTQSENSILFEFLKDIYITKEMLFKIFGGIGFAIIEEETKTGKTFIRKGKIFEFSFLSKNPGVPR